MLVVPPSEIPSNSRLGKYQVLRRFARGGMADLYLGYLPGTLGAFRKLVVLKRVLPDYALDPELVRMFFNEARLAATLAHPNVVSVYDVGAVDGNFFFAMEYLLGRDLHEVVGAAPLGPLPLAHALAIATGVSAGLHYAHEKVGAGGKRLDIVHRDVSPSNVFITYDGQVKLLDFGLARAAGAAADGSGSVWGKPGYMSPEQCLGETLDRRSDVFSVGIILYELTTGMPLFSRSGGGDAMREIVIGKVMAPREIDPNYPPALEAIVLKALARDRLARFQSARELLSALNGFIREAKIELSQPRLSGYVENLFGDDIDGWREAEARGIPFAQHLASMALADCEEAKAIARSNANGARGDLTPTRRLPEADLAALRRSPPSPAVT